MDFPFERNERANEAFGEVAAQAANTGRRTNGSKT